ncbi:HNH endonuclease signature motif containing protein [Curtobacterium sp. MCPF17_003]|uniref:HNH endonuclease signature motif containing protein n=1 Tax=Curtobacterium sp. MCPF17_003 TaxID=2175637 RepID=UPI0015E8DAA4|nr:HNH endonuclease signature motif containing protein [Curtobacterium sp. MCPF17_003]
MAYTASVGEIPEGCEIDHTCGTRDCVEPSHLRAISQAENKQHVTRLYKNNTSGYPGVTFYAARGKWRAQAKRGDRYATLGAFDDPWDAYQAYVAHVREHYPYVDERLLTLPRHT